MGNGSAKQHAGMRLAAPAARAAGRPWVLDPVAVGGLPVRTALARELLAERPTAVRANASEILGLVGDGAGGRGVDATDEVDAAIGAARHLNESCGAVVAISGPVDVVVSTGRLTRVTGGDALMPLVIGTGGALGATTAACLAAARGEAAALVEGAEAYRAQAVNEAQGESARFNSVYAEYAKAPEVTRKRMYLETMEKVLGNVDKVLLDDGAGVVPYLPLDRVRQRAEQPPAVDQTTNPPTGNSQTGGN